MRVVSTSITRILQRDRPLVLCITHPLTIEDRVTHLMKSYYVAEKVVEDAVMGVSLDAVKTSSFT